MARFVSTVTLLLVLSATMAYADITVSLTGAPCANALSGLCTPIASASTITYNALQGSLVNPQIFDLGPNGEAIYTFDTDSVSPFVKGSIAGENAAPPNDVTTYMTLHSSGGPDSVRITFGGELMHYMGFYFGSPDTYNNISFKFIGPTVFTMTSDDFTGAIVPPANGNQSVGTYANFFSNEGFGAVEMSSTQAAFETDNMAFADHVVPEPASFVLLGTCLLGITAIIRRRVSA